MAQQYAPARLPAQNRGLASRPVMRIWRRLVDRPLLCVTALAIVLRLPTFTTRLFDADEAAIGVQGLVVRSGGTLYRDIFDRKPPLPPLAYAASFTLTDSTDIRPMRVLVTVLLVLGGVLVAHDARQRWRSNSHALWAGTLFVAGAMALFPADAGAANYALRAAPRHRRLALEPPRSVVLGTGCRHRAGVGPAHTAELAAGAAGGSLRRMAQRSLAACSVAGGGRRDDGLHGRAVRTVRRVLGVELHQQSRVRVRRCRRGHVVAARSAPLPGSSAST